MVDEESQTPQNDEAKKEEPTISPLDKLEEAKTVLAKIEKEKAEYAKLVAKHEALQVEATLGGRASAGEKAKPKSVDEIETEGAKEFLKGTGYEDIFD